MSDAPTATNHPTQGRKEAVRSLSVAAIDDVTQTENTSRILRRALEAP